MLAPPARADCGVLILRCANGTSGGAWVGVVQALAECGGRCGLLMRPIKVVQVQLVRPVNSFLNGANVVSASKTIAG